MKLNTIIIVLAAFLIATMIEANDFPNRSTKAPSRSKSGMNGKEFMLVLGEGSGQTISSGAEGGLGDYRVWSNPFVGVQEGWVNSVCHRVLPLGGWPDPTFDLSCTYQYGFGKRGSIFAMGNFGTADVTTWNAIVGGTGEFARAVGTIGITWVAEGDDVGGFWQHVLYLW